MTKLPNNILSMGLSELSQALAEKKISAVELTQTYLAHAKLADTEYNSFIHFCETNALEHATHADAKIADGTASALTGIPLGLKDIIITKDIPTTCASNILKNYIPPFNATVTEKLLNQGTVILGKLNMDEFAMGSSNEHSIFGPVKNPWNTNHTPGGSSGGSAASVAAGLVPASLGTDTGGSIRQPASFCGTVGLKPTYGRVSRYGIIAYASSLDQVGPIARNTTDCAMLLQAISGYDPKEATSINTEVPNYTKALTGDIKGKVIGIPSEYFIKGIDPEVESAVKKAATELESLGAHITEVTLPHTKYAVPCYYIIAPAEASSNLAKYDGMRFGKRSPKSDLFECFDDTRTTGFGDEVSLRIIIGTYVLSSGYYDAYYTKALKVRTLIKQDFLNAFESCDAILTPTCPTPAFKLNDRIDDPIKMYLNDIYTIAVNLAGLPGISVPCGFSSDNLPIGMQLIGKPLGEAEILNIAYTYEQHTPWHQKHAFNKDS